MAGSIGERRRALGLTGASIATLIGVNHDRYSRWETGREPLPPARAKQVDVILREHERARERARARLGLAV